MVEALLRTLDPHTTLLINPMLLRLLEHHEAYQRSDAGGQQKPRKHKQSSVPVIATPSRQTAVQSVLDIPAGQKRSRRTTDSGPDWSSPLSSQLDRAVPDLFGTPIAAVAAEGEVPTIRSVSRANDLRTVVSTDSTELSTFAGLLAVERESNSSLARFLQQAALETVQYSGRYSALIKGAVKDLPTSDLLADIRAKLRAAKQNSCTNEVYLLAEAMTYDAFNAQQFQ